MTQAEFEARVCQYLLAHGSSELAKGTPFEVFCRNLTGGASKAVTTRRLRTMRDKRLIRIERKHEGAIRYNVYALQEAHYRPKTMGELVANLREGVTCEVLTTELSVIKLTLDGWLLMQGLYDTVYSTNRGATLFIPKTTDK